MDIFERETVRIPELVKKTQTRWDDIIPFVDVSDTAASVDGTDSHITIRDLFEKSYVRSSNNLNKQNKLYEWIGKFDTSIADLVLKTRKATTGRYGITRYATDSQAKSKSSSDITLTPSNLAAMDATTAFAGLVALATAQEVSEGQVDNKAITPKTLFDSILGDAHISNNQWTFKIPVKNVIGDVKMELSIQVAQAEFLTIPTDMNPQSNFNHIHQMVEFEVIFPEPFTNMCLMVIPVPMEVTPSEYTEATDFWIRPFSIRRSGATLRATRINGVSNGAEEAAVRYLAIGY